MSCNSMEEYIEVEEISLRTKQHLQACNYYIPRRQVSCEARFVSLERDSAGTRTSLRPTLVVYLRTFYLRQATGRFRFREVISSMRLPCLGLALSLSFQSLLRPVWSREISPILVSAVRVMSLDDTFPRKRWGNGDRSVSVNRGNVAFQGSRVSSGSMRTDCIPLFAVSRSPILSFSTCFSASFFQLFFDPRIQFSWMQRDVWQRSLRPPSRYFSETARKKKK